jgi:regulator of protease activity HflC (stomatin/prohibitin superfamily)
VSFSGTAYVSKLGNLHEDDKKLLAKRFHETKTTLRSLITRLGLDELLYEVRAKRDAQNLRAELNKTE